MHNRTHELCTHNEVHSAIHVYWNWNTKNCLRTNYLRTMKHTPSYALWNNTKLYSHNRTNSTRDKPENFERITTCLINTETAKKTAIIR